MKHSHRLAAFWIFILGLSMVGGIVSRPFPSESVDEPSTNHPLSKASSLSQEVPGTKLTSHLPYDSNYDPMFFVRTESGSYLDLTTDDFNGYDIVARQQVWAVGIRTRYGILAFYVNDQDPNFGHGQYLSYPVFRNGSLPAFNRPIMATFVRLWAHVGGTWYESWLTSQPLYQANSADIRLSMVASNTSGVMQFGWNETLTMDGFAFQIYMGMKYDPQGADPFKINFVHQITSLDRAWDGLGLEYVIAQSRQYDNTDYQILYGTVENEDERIQYRLSAFKDMTTILPAQYNRTRLIMANNQTIHEFDWQDLRNVGFDTTLFRIEQMTFPDSSQDWVLRVGMYAITPVPQGYRVEIDPSQTLNSHSAEIYPYSVVRDSNDIPYILYADSAGTLTIAEGNAGSPTSFSNTSVSNSWSQDFDNAGMCIGEYSGTEYLWVAYKNSGNKLHVKRYDTATMSETDQGELENNIEGAVSVGYDATNEDVVIHYGATSKVGKVEYSTNGGSSFSETTTWTYNSYVRGLGLAFNGTGWHLVVGVGSNREAYFKYFIVSTTTLYYYTGSAWSTTDDSTLGYGAWDFDAGNTIHGSASGNIIMFSHGQYLNDAFSMYSLDDGKSWNTTPNHWSSGGAFSSHIIKTETGEVDDVVSVYPTPKSTFIDLSQQTYDYSGPSWGSSSYVSDESTGDFAHVAGELTQTNGWVAWAYRRYDGTSTYTIYFNTTEVGGVADTDPPNIDYNGNNRVTNNSDVACFTSILVNWSIDDIGDNPDSYIIFSNETGTGNVSRTSGSYTDGAFKSHSFANTNTSNVGLTLFFQIWANDTAPNWNSSIIYVDIISIFSLNIVETNGNWSTSAGVVAGDGLWIYLDQPSKQFLNLSIQGSSNWEIRGYINDTSAELNIKAYITDSSGGSMPEVETWWDSGGTQLTGSELVISGGDNQAAGDYTDTTDQYGIWLVVQVQPGGDPYYGVLLTLIIYSE